MGLEQQLEAFKQEFLRTAQAGRPALYEAKIEELRSSFALETAAGVGTVSPDFRLPDVRGDLVSLTDLLRDGPVVVTFYRGGWCPLQYPVAGLSSRPVADGGFRCTPRGNFAAAS